MTPDGSPPPTPESTPPFGYQMWARETDCYGRHQRTNDTVNKIAGVVERCDRSLAVLVGEHGDNGKIGTLIEELERHDRSRDDHDARLRKVEVSVAKGYVIIALLAALGSILGSAIVSSAIRYVSLPAAATQQRVEKQVEKPSPPAALPGT